MKKLAFALAAAGASVFLMAATPGFNMIELQGQNHKVFPCKDKNKIIKKRSGCMDFNGYGGVPGRVFVKDYIIHCMTGGTKGPKKQVTYVTWNLIGRCTKGMK